MNNKLDPLETEIVTPAYVFDAAKLARRVAFIKETLGARFKIVYAIKANPFLVSDLIGAVDGFEVCSPGEYRICERVGVSPTDIVLSGVYKEENDITRIVGACKNKTVYTVESPDQAELLSSVACRYAVTIPVIIRLSSGNQFGMDGESVKRLILSKPVGLDILGIQLYSGTQKKPEKIVREIGELIDFVNMLKRECAFDCRRIEYGPGMGVTYFVNEPPRDDVAAMQAVKNAFAAVPQNVELVLEMGRFIAAHCGEYHTRIVDKKTTDGVNYVIVDGGINHLNYYGQVMAMKQPFLRIVGNNTDRLQEVAASGTAVKHTVCGSLCTTADVLVKDCPMGTVEIGDTVVFDRVGAYSVSESIYLFLSRDMPRIYKRADGGKLVLLRDIKRTDIFNG